MSPPRPLSARLRPLAQLGLEIPLNLDFGKAFPMLRTEDKEKLAAVRPLTLHAAGRIPGVTAAALMLLFKYLKAHPEIPQEHQLTQ